MNVGHAHDLTSPSSVGWPSSPTQNIRAERRADSLGRPEQIGAVPWSAIGGANVDALAARGVFSVNDVSAEGLDVNAKRRRPPGVSWAPSGESDASSLGTFVVTLVLLAIVATVGYVVLHALGIV